MKPQRETIWLFGVVVLILLFTSTSTASVGQQLSAHADGNALSLPLPPGFRMDVLLAEHQVRDRLHNAVSEHLLSNHTQHDMGDPEGATDLIVILLDDPGQPILPDLEAARDGGRDFALTVSNELAFTFDSYTYPWSAGELATLSTTLNDCYPIAKTIYGPPAFNITVNVRKDPTITFAGLYYASINEMVLKRVTTPDPICHE